MPDTLETPRMLLLPLNASHIGVLRELSGDPAVVRYIGNGQPWLTERLDDVLTRMLEHWRAYGFGWRIAVDKAAGEPVGSILLNHLGAGTAGLGEGEFEIGWWLFPSAWGRGFATEGAHAICEEAFTRVGAPSVLARILPANGGSVGVAQRLGMALDFQTTGRFGETVSVYRLDAADWHGANVPRPDGEAQDHG